VKTITVDADTFARIADRVARRLANERVIEPREQSARARAEFDRAAEAIADELHRDTLDRMLR